MVDGAEQVIVKQVKEAVKHKLWQLHDQKQCLSNLAACATHSVEVGEAVRASVSQLTHSVEELVAARTEMARSIRYKRAQQQQQGGGMRQGGGNLYLSDANETGMVQVELAQASVMRIKHELSKLSQIVRNSLTFHTRSSVTRLLGGTCNRNQFLIFRTIDFFSSLVYCSLLETSFECST
jgi:hypothetical protein